ncbi:amidase [Gordonia sp. CPCC 206044]|uniref:amidase n=1 Tax=Gordonia sp. CPCC 206044 TaxID=3140793 RepID=UPI003AF3ECC9
MAELHPVYWPVRDLTAAYACGDLDPVSVVEDVIERIDEVDARLHAYTLTTPELARAQARSASERYRRGDIAPLLGVPVSVKDAFHMADQETSLGSLTQRGRVARSDSGAVARLRQAGAVFAGKTNVPEFCQSATNENLLGHDTMNPWDPSRTPGGSSGGAAVSVAAGMATVGLGSDGGGSIRIPAAFCGLVGVKPSLGLCPDERGFRAMTDFVSAGPLARNVDDARLLVEVLSGSALDRADVPTLRIGYCPRPEGRPVDPEIVEHMDLVAKTLVAQGHDVIEHELPLEGWNEIFGPLVLDDELRERAHLLDAPDLLTRYERASLLAAQRLSSQEVADARAALASYRTRINADLHVFDVYLTPTVATPAFRLGQRPTTIDETPVDWLWGAFPFTSPFNVAGTPAVTLPVGLARGLPVGAQLVGASGTDARLLDLAENVERAVAFDQTPVVRRWADGKSPIPAGAQR